MNSPVNEQVSRKSAAPFEAFSTLFALKNLLRAVDCPGFVGENGDEYSGSGREGGNICKCIN